LGQVAYSIVQAAATTATTEATITEAIRDERLQARVVGTIVVIAHEELTRWVDSLPYF